jgi:hypothetical protein
MLFKIFWRDQWLTASLDAFRIILVDLVGFSSSAQAQIYNVTNETSTPIHGTGHDYIQMLSETVNPANGSASVRLETPVPQGRQLSLPFSFAYDSNGVCEANSVNGQGGWKAPKTFLSQGGMVLSRADVKRD